jgi:hypothetical protein
MHSLASTQIDRHSEHLREGSALPFGTEGTVSIQGAQPRFDARSIKFQTLAGSALRIAAARLRSHVGHNGCTIQPRNVVAAILVMMFGLCWCDGFGSHSRFYPLDQKAAVDMNSVAEQIIKVESNGDRNAKNKRSSATGLGQFVNETWLALVRAHRPDLAKERAEGEILELRRDADIAREITVRFVERNAWILRKRGLPVTPGTLYLAHFAGGAGAVAILSADEQADAATIMANADGTRRTRREKLVKLNPFLDQFTVADLKLWADRKMRNRANVDKGLRQQGDHIGT